MEHLNYQPRAGVQIAYHRYTGNAPDLPGVVWLGGFRSDMTGIKATFLEEQCKQRGQSFIRFDYQGHGASGGRFMDCTLSTWLQDALDVLDNLTTGPQILVGSSMGGWLSLLVARQRPSHVVGLVGIAAAPDFSADIYNHEFTNAQRAALEKDGVVYIPSQYGDPYPLTKNLFADAKQHLLLDKTTPINIPVRLLQGKMDDAVPWQKAERIKTHILSPDIRVTYIDDGDHRLSRPEDLALIEQALVDINGLVRKKAA